jgi:Na+-transporting NADH:ubiquinone oxidoreductase subunit NqrB
MNTFINYLIELNLGLVFFYALYWLLFRNETQFTTKRWFLLSAMLGSLLFPLIHNNRNTKRYYPCTWQHHTLTLATRNCDCWSWKCYYA